MEHCTAADPSSIRPPDSQFSLLSVIIHEPPALLSYRSDPRKQPSTCSLFTSLVPIYFTSGYTGVSALLLYFSSSYLFHIWLYWCISSSALLLQFLSISHLVILVYQLFCFTSLVPIYFTSGYTGVSALLLYFSSSCLFHIWLYWCISSSALLLQFLSISRLVILVYQLFCFTSLVPIYFTSGYTGVSALLLYFSSSYLFHIWLYWCISSSALLLQFLSISRLVILVYQLFCFTSLVPIYFTSGYTGVSALLLYFSSSYLFHIWLYWCISSSALLLQFLSISHLVILVYQLFCFTSLVPIYFTSGYTGVSALLLYFSSSYLFHIWLYWCISSSALLLQFLSISHLVILVYQLFCFTSLVPIYFTSGYTGVSLYQLFCFTSLVPIYFTSGYTGVSALLLYFSSSYLFHIWLYWCISSSALLLQFLSISHLVILVYQLFCFTSLVPVYFTSGYTGVSALLLYFSSSYLFHIWLYWCISSSALLLQFLSISHLVILVYQLFCFTSLVPIYFTSGYTGVSALLLYFSSSYLFHIWLYWCISSSALLLQFLSISHLVILVYQLFCFTSLVPIYFTSGYTGVSALLLYFSSSYLFHIWLCWCISSSALLLQFLSISHLVMLVYQLFCFTSLVPIYFTSGYTGVSALLLYFSSSYLFHIWLYWCISSSALLLQFLSISHLVILVYQLFCFTSLVPIYFTSGYTGVSALLLYFSSSYLFHIWLYWCISSSALLLQFLSISHLVILVYQLFCFTSLVPIYFTSGYTGVSALLLYFSSSYLFHIWLYWCISSSALLLQFLSISHLVILVYQLFCFTSLVPIYFTSGYTGVSALLLYFSSSYLFHIWLYWCISSSALLLQFLSISHLVILVYQLFCFTSLVPIYFTSGYTGVSALLLYFSSSYLFHIWLYWCISSSALLLQFLSISHLVILVYQLFCFTSLVPIYFTSGYTGVSALLLYFSSSYLFHIWLYWCISSSALLLQFLSISHLVILVYQLFCFTSLVPIYFTSGYTGVSALLLYFSSSYLFHIWLYWCISSSALLLQFLSISHLVILVYQLFCFTSLVPIYFTSGYTGVSALLLYFSSSYLFHIWLYWCISSSALLLQFLSISHLVILVYQLFCFTSLVPIYFTSGYTGVSALLLYFSSSYLFHIWLYWCISSSALLLQFLSISHLVILVYQLFCFTSLVPIYFTSGYTGVSALLLYFSSSYLFHIWLYWCISSSALLLQFLSISHLVILVYQLFCFTSLVPIYFTSGYTGVSALLLYFSSSYLFHIWLYWCISSSALLLQFLSISHLVILVYQLFCFTSLVPIYFTSGYTGVSALLLYFSSSYLFHIWLYWCISSSALLLQFLSISHLVILVYQLFCFTSLVPIYFTSGYTGVSALLLYFSSSYLFHIWLYWCISSSALLLQFLSISHLVILVYQLFCFTSLVPIYFTSGYTGVSALLLYFSSSYLFHIWLYWCISSSALLLQFLSISHLVILVYQLFCFTSLVPIYFTSGYTGVSALLLYFSSSYLFHIWLYWCISSSALLLQFLSISHLVILVYQLFCFTSLVPIYFTSGYTGVSALLLYFSSSYLFHIWLYWCISSSALLLQFLSISHLVILVYQLFCFTSLVPIYFTSGYTGVSALLLYFSSSYLFHIWLYWCISSSALLLQFLSISHLVILVYQLFCFTSLVPIYFTSGYTGVSALLLYFSSSYLFHIWLYWCISSSALLLQFLSISHLVILVYQLFCFTSLVPIYFTSGYTGVSALLLYFSSSYLFHIWLYWCISSSALLLQFLSISHLVILVYQLFCFTSLVPIYFTSGYTGVSALLLYFSSSYLFHIWLYWCISSSALLLQFLSISHLVILVYQLFCFTSLVPIYFTSGYTGVSALLLYFSSSYLFHIWLYWCISSSALLLQFLSISHLVILVYQLFCFTSLVPIYFTSGYTGVSALLLYFSSSYLFHIWLYWCISSSALLLQFLSISHLVILVYQLFCFTSLVPIYFTSGYTGVSALLLYFSSSYLFHIWLYWCISSSALLLQFLSISHLVILVYQLFCFTSLVPIYFTSGYTGVSALLLYFSSSYLFHIWLYWCISSSALLLQFLSISHLVILVYQLFCFTSLVPIYFTSGYTGVSALLLYFSSSYLFHIWLYWCISSSALLLQFLSISHLVILVYQLFCFTSLVPIYFTSGYTGVSALLLYFSSSYLFHIWLYWCISSSALLLQFLSISHLVILVYQLFCFTSLVPIYFTSGYTGVSALLLYFSSSYLFHIWLYWCISSSALLLQFLSISHLVILVYQLFCFTSLVPIYFTSGYTGVSALLLYFSSSYLFHIWLYWCISSSALLLQFLSISHLVILVYQLFCFTSLVPIYFTSGYTGVSALLLYFSSSYLFHIWLYWCISSSALLLQFLSISHLVILVYQLFCFTSLVPIYFTSGYTGVSALLLYFSSSYLFHIWLYWCISSSALLLQFLSISHLVILVYQLFCFTSLVPIYFTSGYTGVSALLLYFSSSYLFHIWLYWCISSSALLLQFLSISHLVILVYQLFCFTSLVPIYFTSGYTGVSALLLYFSSSYLFHIWLYWCISSSALLLQFLSISHLVILVYQLFCFTSLVPIYFTSGYTGVSALLLYFSSSYLFHIWLYWCISSSALLLQFLSISHLVILVYQLFCFTSLVPIYFTSGYTGVSALLLYFSSSYLFHIWLYWCISSSALLLQFLSISHLVILVYQLFCFTSLVPIYFTSGYTGVSALLLYFSSSYLFHIWLYWCISSSALLLQFLSISHLVILVYQLFCFTSLVPIYFTSGYTGVSALLLYFSSSYLFHVWLYWCISSSALLLQFLSISRLVILVYQLFCFTSLVPIYFTSGYTGVSALLLYFSSSYLFHIWLYWCISSSALLLQFLSISHLVILVYQLFCFTSLVPIYFTSGYTGVSALLLYFSSSYLFHIWLYWCISSSALLLQFLSISHLVILVYQLFCFTSLVPIYFTSGYTGVSALLLYFSSSYLFHIWLYWCISSSALLLQFLSISHLVILVYQLFCFTSLVPIYFTSGYTGVSALLLYFSSSYLFHIWLYWCISSSALLLQFLSISHLVILVYQLFCFTSLVPIYFTSGYTGVSALLLYFSSSYLFHIWLYWCISSSALLLQFLSISHLVILVYQLFCFTSLVPIYFTSGYTGVSALLLYFSSSYLFHIWLYWCISSSALLLQFLSISHLVILVYQLFCFTSLVPIYFTSGYTGVSALLLYFSSSYLFHIWLYWCISSSALLLQFLSISPLVILVYQLFCFTSLVPIYFTSGYTGVSALLLYFSSSYLFHLWLYWCISSSALLLQFLSISHLVILVYQLFCFTSLVPIYFTSGYTGVSALLLYFSSSYLFHIWLYWCISSSALLLQFLSISHLVILVYQLFCFTSLVPIYFTSGYTGVSALLLYFSSSYLFHIWLYWCISFVLMVLLSWLFYHYQMSIRVLFVWCFW